MITKKTIGAFLAGVSVLPLFLMLFAQSGDIIELDFVDWQAYALAGVCFIVAAAFLFVWDEGEKK